MSKLWTPFQKVFTMENGNYLVSLQRCFDATEMFHLIFLQGMTETIKITDSNKVVTQVLPTVS